MDKIETLWALEEIRLLKAKYFHCMDTQNWDMWQTLFTDDLKVLGEDGKVAMEGSDAFVSMVKEYLAGCQTTHIGHSSELEIMTETEAKGVWAFHDVLRWKDGDPREGLKELSGWGHYHETYRKQADGWKISSQMITRTHVDQYK